MGIKSLAKLLKKNCPEIYEEIHISEYAYKKIAIDISIFICKYKIMYKDRWLTNLINLIVCLRRNEIHCVIIFDGSAPPEKDAEKKARADQRSKLEERVFNLEHALEKYHTTLEVDPILIELYNRKKKKMSNKRLLKKVPQIVDMKIVEDSVRKMRGHILDICQNDYKLAKQLFDVLGVPYLQAPSEAETLCSDLCKRGLVDAVLSEDTDVLAYGAPVFLFRINTKEDTCSRIKYPVLLEALELSDSEFLDLCIMCGTDYNKNIFRVGPEKAYKYIQKYSTIEGVGDNTSLDIKILNHIRGRELFRDYKKVDVKIPFCGTPDFEGLGVFITENNIIVSIGSVKKAFTHSTAIVFEDSDDYEAEIVTNSMTMCEKEEDCEITIVIEE